MKSKIYLFIILTCLLCSAHASATIGLPPIAIKGTVTGDDGGPIPGVSVSIKGTKTIVVTDGDGNYRISVPDGKGTLVFSHVSYQRVEVPINGKVTVNATMKALAGDLNEVVVIGYGTQDKRSVTGSIGTMKAVDLEKYNVQTFQSALQGRIAGVDISESSGVPGAALNVRIRGLTSINGTSGPLYIVDGNPVFTGADGDGDAPVTSGIPTGTHTNPLTDINPNDIESIEVLKDAAATAIYGARGGAGVILITTKRGKTGQTAYNVTATSGYNRISKEVPLLNGPQLLSVLDQAWRNEFYSNPANYILPVPATPMPAMTGFTRGIADTTNINHLKEVLQTGSYKELNMSATNGTDFTKYYINGNFKRTVPTVKGVDMNQFSLRVNIDHNLSKFVTIGVSLSPAYSKTNRLGSGDVTALGGYGGALVTNLPIYPNYNADGTYFNPWTNPLAFQDRDLYSNSESRFRLPASAYVEAKLLKSLTFRTMVQREDWNQQANSNTSGILRLRSADNTNSLTSPFANDQLARQTFANSYGYSNSWQSFFTYKKNFKKFHDFEGTTGMNFSESSSFYEALNGENFASSNFIYPSQGAYIDVNNGQTIVDGDISANLSYFARGFYKYKSKYLASLVVNREGNSRFGGDRRFGTFPAASLGWIASDEKFLKKSKVISFLKFRASGGLTGSSAGISNRANFSVWQVSNNSNGYMSSAQLLATAPANKNLHWEKGIKFDAGLDAGFFKGRITTTIDFYANKTTEMLLDIPTSATFGYGQNAQSLNFLENRGSLSNKGIEIALNTNNLTGKFKWRSTINFTRNITKILDIGGLSPQTVSAGPTNAVMLYVDREGPVYNLVEWVGVDKQTGGELVRDKDGNTVLASTLTTDQLLAARRPQYDKLAAPKFYGGINNSFQYKAFDLSIFFAYKYGNYLLDRGERIRSYVGNINATNYANNSTSTQQGTAVSTITVGNLSPDILGMWMYPGHETNIPKVYWSDRVGAANNPNTNLRETNTTRFLHEASYIRLKNVQLTYTLPAKVVRRLGVKSAKINATGQNLLLFTKFPGADPEAITISTASYRERNLGYGIIQDAMPLPKTLTFGINVGF